MSSDDAPPISRLTATEHRDDLETFTSESDSRTGIPFGTVLDVPSGNFNCRVSSICQSVDIANCPKEDDAFEKDEEQNKKATEEQEEAFDSSNPLDDTMMDFHDERLDLNSVLSGNMEEDDATSQMNDEAYSNGVSVKNLSKLFEENDEANRRLNAANATTSKPGGQPSTNRPPLAPPKANIPLKSEEGTASNITDISNAIEDKRLSVFLRIRPPVSANGKEGVDGSISTIEVLDEGTALPSTIRTYPPMNSNAAKVVRAGNKLAPSNLKKNLSSKSLTDDGSSDSGGDSTAEVLGVKEYSYSGVFGPNSTQNEIYDSVAAPLVDGLFQDQSGELGESALLFTLGVTNAGKTHTVMGTGFEKKKLTDKNLSDLSPHRDWGIIPRSLHHMLSRINTSNAIPSSRPKLQLYMSYLEIYNEQIFDLLPDKTKQVPRRPCDGPTALKLRESRRGRIFVRGLARHPINNVHQGLELAQEAKKNRHTASNNINTSSSRSHSICQFEIAHFRAHSSNSKSVQSEMDTLSDYDTDDDSSVSSAGSKKGRNSTIIWIVDLAGSERSKRTGVISHTRHQKEAALINASLMNLMRCLREMLNNQPKKRGATKGGVVPFRESKLTHMFMNHLTGPSASRTSMIVNVNPAADDFDETQHVLSYATTARNVKISAVDYNKKRRILAKESNVKLSPVKKIANLVHKLSPKKRKGSGDSKPETKRLRSNTGPKYIERKKPVKEVAISKKPLPVKAQWNRNDELEKLREENFSLKIAIDDLEQQLADCEADVRAEVVEMMNEQLQDSKEWYEGRIDNLKRQLGLLEASNSKQAHHDADSQEKMIELFDRINECEEEMKRMREEHEAEMEDKSAELLNMTNMHQAELEQAVLVHQDELRTERSHKERLLEENGVLRHQALELRASHDTILSKYKELLSLYEQSEQKESSDIYESADMEGDPESIPGDESASTFKKLSRDRCSDVASTAASVEIVSPKGKGGKWGFLRSPAKVALGEKSESAAKSRSPLGKLNPNLN
ncbi:hypothetical protein HJC23_005355 [Cyclotella cryptica]|uniref:Kinesin motor domain-containing protein n=1 Tax=Cyclotella cryptica TaxID=29204 RepID=A0ABD3PEL5_9STRA|eukprot:CCRYP_015354-RA/>CCRYP_015354-RA protein AED:0.07 eAED:0.07 QI:0/0/0/1/1/1/2/0/1017